MHAFRAYISKHPRANFRAQTGKLEKSPTTQTQMFLKWHPTTHNSTIVNPPINYGSNVCFCCLLLLSIVLDRESSRSLIVAGDVSSLIPLLHLVFHA